MNRKAALSLAVAVTWSACDLRQHPTRDELLAENAQLHGALEEAKEHLSDVQSAIENAKSAIGDECEDAESELDEAERKIGEAEAALD